ncbi:hypothetical protein VP01_37g4 [Puccinia sorghi]|uniref:DDE Tnp4 domain-containing protein n=1 Tax=Puccinia sorghi TaxID=27349 RepID=A0A0L6UVA9_9BASI|nr:hypothetical protein VP01_37g4 [Puccinia sorghi]
MAFWLVSSGSEGSVILYCSQVVEAILSLERCVLFYFYFVFDILIDSWIPIRQYVVRPNSQGQHAMASRIARFTGLKNCFGFIDGTLLPLEEKKMIDPQDYYFQKGIYGLATLIVCDNHNTRLWENSDLNLQERTLFSPGQYLLGDSGFLTESNLVPAFKKPPHGQIPCLRKKFNQHLASLRVCNKHCIGILKSQFQLLRGLRLELMSVELMERITQWVGACVILHNYLLHDETPSISMADEDHSPSIIPDHLPCRGTNSSGNNLCKKVFQEALSHIGLNEE